MTDSNDKFDLYELLRSWTMSIPSFYSAPPEHVEHISKLCTELREFCSEHGYPCIAWAATGLDEKKVDSSVSISLPQNPGRVSVEAMVAIAALVGGMNEAGPFLITAMGHTGYRQAKVEQAKNPQIPKDVMEQIKQQFGNKEGKLQ